MTRPLRIEFDGALYHVTARGDRQGRIFLSASDHLAWQTILAETCARFNFVVHAFCQMTNHYHLVVETRSGGLARGMRHLNGNYSQYFNRQHRLVGHVFQGRYGAILCQQEIYLMALARYVMLNPVRAKMVLHPADWPWSSYRATLGMDDAPPWLQTGQLLAPFASAQSAGRLAFADFVMQGIDEPSPLRNANSQLVLGDSGFCDRVVGMDVTGDLHEVRSSQRRAIAHTLTEYFAMYPDPKMAMARAYLSMGHSMPEIARFCGMSVKTVSRAVKRFAELDDAY